MNNDVDCIFEILVDNSMERKDQDLCFGLCDGNLLVKSYNNNINVPTWKEIKDIKIDFNNIHCLGKLRGTCCYAIEIKKNMNLKDGYKLIPLYDSGSMLEEELFCLAGMANQILFWDITHKFCGKCGGKLTYKSGERAKICKTCNQPIYPVICPAIIVAIIKEDEILLAHNKTFKNNMYSIIAGFVDAGESLEDCVRREVFEEVGLKIKNIKYFGNQPWGFPNALMVGFFAEYESGEIKVDGEEISDANWYKRDNFPNLPQKMSIARKMIDYFSENY